jgi:phosphohistidine swiveling domain-containing protein
MKPNWLLVVSFKTELLSEYLIHKGYREDLPILLPKVGLLRNRMIIENDIYVDLNEVAQVQKALTGNILKYGDETYKVIEEQSNNLLSTAVRASEVTQGTSNHEIIEKLNAFFSEYQKTLGAIGIPTIIDLTLESTIKKHLADSGVPNVEDAFGNLAFSFKPVATNQEREDLLDIAVRKNSGEDIDELVKIHSQKYGWLYSTLFLGDEYTPDKILGELSLIENPEKERMRILGERNKQSENSSKVIVQIKSLDGKEIAKFLQKAVYFRTARLEWMNHACFIVRPLLNEVAKRIEISFGDLIYLYPKEILEALNDPSTIRIDVIRERQKGYAFISNDVHEYSLFIGNELKEWKNKFATKLESNIVKGIVACKGKVEGRVVLVKDRSELNKVQRGDILITPLTTPDFIIAMKKASAIVTDLGGMTSHAAIVSRELGTPCIVGTKNATRVFKDGDQVEVDAEKGTVRKI